jgi:hypothetical protein
MCAERCGKTSGWPGLPVIRPLLLTFVTLFVDVMSVEVVSLGIGLYV